VYLSSSLWLTDILRRYPDISGGRHPDLLHVFYGEPTVYRWGGGDQHGAVYVHTDRRETHTTADDAGRHKLYYVTGIAPTDALMGYVLSLPQHHEGRRGGGGGGGGGGAEEAVGEVVAWGGGGRREDGGGGPGHWLVWLVPTAACRSMFCTALRPEVVGPLPPFPGDRALPNMGYSFVLMYIGDRGRHRVAVYVEDGYVISSGFSLTVSRVRNYKLVEVDKVWEPFEAVIVGPGWWVPYRPLGHCKTMSLNTSSIYATPERTGPVKVTVEDGGARYNYTFYVTSDVKYRITTRTPAPASLTATPFNITVRVLLGGVPYAYGLGDVLLRDVPHFHYIYGFGEGGRLSPPVCVSTLFNNTYYAPQLVLSGDFWSSFGLANTPLKPVNIQYIYSKPRLELADPWRGLVRVRADGPVSGFAFYAQRGGTWVKIGEAGGRCVLVNASRIIPLGPHPRPAAGGAGARREARRARSRSGAPRPRFCLRPGPTLWGTQKAPEAS
jgi:hypothetical protein